MKIEVEIPDDLIRIRDTLDVIRELASGSPLKDALDAAALETGRCIANYVLVSIEEQR